MADRLISRSRLALGFTLWLGACSGQPLAPDAEYTTNPPVDAHRNTDFRDAAGCGSGSGSGQGFGSGSGSGSGCGSGGPTMPCDAVTFSYTSATATSVWVTGSFTTWAASPPGARPLVAGGAGQWSLTTQVGMGRQLYKFVINGTTWIADPSNPDHEPDGFGGTNSVVVTCAGQS